MDKLGEKVLKGGLARVCAQSANLLLRIASLALLARLLDPRDFGLVGMVVAVTGILSLFRDFGLSAASVQHAHVTEDQTSNLFWINVAFGAALSVVTAISAPLLASFYREPRLVAITIAMAGTFLLNSAGIQHSARLQREMRFTTLSVIDTGSWVVSTGIAIAGAKAGWGYWALVAMAVTGPLVSTVAFWAVTGWVPQLPRRNAGIGSMLRFGGTLTLNGTVVYIASNFEKVLLGRYWGADVIGIYGRAYQLIRIPTDTLTGAIGEVAFSALSRVQDDADRLRNYFLRGYSLVLALTLPATFACAVFATDLISYILGPKWTEAAPIFRLLTPTILVFAMANPLAWLVSALGMVMRGLKISLVIAPILLAGYFIGLPHGPKGVAIAYSGIMVLWLAPVIAWSVRGTAVSFGDVVSTASKPLIASAVAGMAALIFLRLFQHNNNHLIRLVLGNAVLVSTYLITILYIMGQKSYYIALFKKFVNRQPLQAEILTQAQ